MPPARSPRRELCRGDALDLAWRATLRAEAARERCGDPAANAGRRRRVRRGHLATQTSSAPKRRPSGGRATGRLTR